MLALIFFLAARSRFTYKQAGWKATPRLWMRRDLRSWSAVLPRQNRNSPVVSANGPESFRAMDGGCSARSPACRCWLSLHLLLRSDSCRGARAFIIHLDKRTPGGRISHRKTTINQ